MFSIKRIYLRQEKKTKEKKKRTKEKKMKLQPNTNKSSDNKINVMLKQALYTFAF